MQVIWGMDDVLLPVENAYRLKEFYEAELILIPKAGHVAQMERPELVAASIKSFANTLAEK